MLVDADHLKEQPASLFYMCTLLRLTYQIERPKGGPQLLMGCEMPYLSHTSIVFMSPRRTNALPVQRTGRLLHETMR